MQTEKKPRFTVSLGYWTVCRGCGEWTENAVEDCWNPAPGVGWWCPSCAAGEIVGEFPLLMPEAKHEPKPVQRATLWGLFLRWVRSA